jgi:hypothetical protein
MTIGTEASYNEGSTRRQRESDLHLREEVYCLSRNIRCHSQIAAATLKIVDGCNSNRVDKMLTESVLDRGERRCNCRELKGTSIDHS